MQIFLTSTHVGKGIKLSCELGTSERYIPLPLVGNNDINTD